MVTRRTRHDIVPGRRGCARRRRRDWAPHGLAPVVVELVVVELVIVASLVAVELGGGSTAEATVVPDGFRQTTAIAGLTEPTALRFSPDGRVFVAEKSGIIKVFDGLADTTPTVFADLRTEVHDYWDRGLLGLALAPTFPADPWVYVLYAHDAAIGGDAPRWGVAGATSDGCPTPPGPTADGCVVSGRLSRLRADGDVAVGAEQVLIEDWCQQYPSHSVGDLEFGRDGALYVSGGEGANFAAADYGQKGVPVNPCGDPPGGTGAALSPPTAEGGALRAQDLRTSGDPVALGGSVLRVDPATGAGLPGNPLAASPDANARRIIGYGFRNPFRFALRPGTDDVWVGDVGWNDFEEIDRIEPPIGAPTDFGWPCYEGDGRQPGYDSLDLAVCEDLYAQGPSAVRMPAFRYAQVGPVVEGETCTISGGASVSGLAFGPTTATNYPAPYRGALFFADYTRRCIFVVPAGADGNPDFARIESFVGDAAKPVDLQFGPGGDLFYVDLGGTIRRITYTAGANRPPIATLAADPVSGPVPLTVAFDGSRSTDPDSQSLTYAWDLDGDGALDDATGATASRTYTAPEPVTVRLRVTDPLGLTDETSILVSPGNSPPRPTIALTAGSTGWAVGDVISFSGGAADDEEGALAASALRWDLVMDHCHLDGGCHEHPVQSFDGVTGASVVAPDHEYPSYLELRLTATDAGGLSASTSVRLDPRTVVTTLATDPPGLSVVVGSDAHITPASVTSIARSSQSVSAPAVQSLGGEDYRFVRWSDGGPRTHEVVTDTARTLTAFYELDWPTIVPGTSSVVEGSAATTSVSVPVTLSSPSARTVSVAWSTLRPASLPGAPADPGSDYVAASGRITFAPGETARTVAISVLGDALDEPDEYLIVSFTSPTDATLGGVLGLGFAGIVDDDDPPSVVPGAVSVPEGSAGATAVSVPVRLSAPSAKTVTVAWSTFRPANLPGSPADPGSDYVVAGGTVTFLPGETAKTVPISVLGDRLVEPDEYALVSFTSPTNAVLGGFLGLAFLTIVDDD